MLSLHTVKDQANQLRAYNREELKYDKYSVLLLSAATNYDNQFSVKSTKISRRIYNTELTMNHLYFYENLAYNAKDRAAEDVDYDIDSPISTLLANLKKVNPSSYLPSDKYRLLSPEVRDLWSKIPDDMKTIIIQGRNKGAKLSNSYSKIVLIAISLNLLHLNL